jgi:hypothetical protein
MSKAGTPLPEFELPYTAYGHGGQNGRVNLSAPTGASNSVAKLQGFQHPTQTEVNFSGDMLRGNWEHTALSDAYFSRINAQRIQKEITSEVYRRSGPKKYQIDDQDVDELKMIMRGMYYQYAKNQPTNVQAQVLELNERVLAWSVPHILSAVDHYIYYLKDIDTLPVPMAQPMHLSSAGTRTKTLKPFM